MAKVTKIIIEAYETNSDDFNVLVVYFANGERVGYEKLEGYKDQQKAFIDGWHKATNGRDLSNWVEARFDSNKFKRELAKVG